jgi:DNA-binding FadR family transcriptional regulator
MEDTGDAAHPRSRRGYGGHADELRDEIKSLLLSQGLRPGDTIPSEATLIEQLGVSRGSLREALKSLQSMGIIETRHGSGTFVSTLSFESLVDGLLFHIELGGSDARSLIFELTEIREILETAFVRRVAGTLTPGRIAELDDLITRMDERAEQGEGIDDLDREFHHALYAELDRKIANGLIESFWRVLNQARPELPPSVKKIAVARKHRAIVDALAAGDADAAAAAMRDHFEDTREWVALADR